MSDVFTVRVRLAAPVEQVHHALTDPGELRSWFAEHAEVDLPRRYEFWGRYTPEGAEPRQRVLHADERTLRFGWLLEGVQTVVEIDLAADGPDATVLTFSQTELPDFMGSITGTGSRALMQTFWSLAIANLADHLAGRALTTRCDFGDPRMHETVEIDAPRAEVYDALVDAEQFRRWFGVEVGIEPWEDGRFAMGGFDANPQAARIFDVRPGAGMSIDFGGVVATWELAESDGRTTLTFVQSGFDTDQPPYDAWMGWLSGVAELRRYVEAARAPGGRDAWRPIWLSVEMPGMPEGMLTY